MPIIVNGTEIEILKIEGVEEEIQEAWCNGVLVYTSAPTGVKAIADSISQITVSWKAVRGATGYNVYRSATVDMQDMKRTVLRLKSAGHL